MFKGNIEKIQQHSRVDLSYFFSGVFWLAVNQTVEILASLATAFFFARFLSKETFGNYQYVLAMAGLLPIFTLSGLPAAVTRFVAIGQQSVIRLAIKKQLLWSLTGSVLALFLAGYYLISHNFNFALVFFVIAIVFPLTNSFSLTEAYLSGKGEFEKQGKYYSTQRIILASFLVLTSFVFNENFFLVLPIFFLIEAGTNIFIYKVATTGVPKIEDKENKTVAYGKKLSLINLVNIIAERIDSLVLFFLLGPANLAIYIYAVAMPEQIKALFKIIASVGFPRLAQSSLKEIRKNLARHIFLLFLLAISITAIYIFLADGIFSLFFPKYLESATYSKIFALSSLTLPLTIFSAVLQSHGLIKRLFLHQTLVSFSQIFLVIAFGYFWGILGVILARILTRTINFSLGCFLVLKK